MIFPPNTFESGLRDLNALASVNPQQKTQLQGPNVLIGQPCSSSVNWPAPSPLDLSWVSSFVPPPPFKDELRTLLGSDA